MSNQQPAALVIGASRGIGRSIAVMPHELGFRLVLVHDAGAVASGPIGSCTLAQWEEATALYSASKHALLGMTKAAARGPGADGIRVHAVLPGGGNTARRNSAFLFNGLTD